MDDLLADVKTKAYALSVELFCVFKKAKQLEKLLLVLLADTAAIVNYLDLECTIFSGFHRFNKILIVFEG